MSKAKDIRDAHTLVAEDKKMRCGGCSVILPEYNKDYCVDCISTFDDIFVADTWND